MEARICVVCGKEFFPRVHNQTCCSAKCSEKLNKKRIEQRLKQLRTEPRACAQCGKMFDPEGRNYTLCPECRVKRNTRVCEDCGRTFVRENNTHPKFCPECRAKREPRVAICNICKRPFKRTQSIKTTCPDCLKLLEECDHEIYELRRCHDCGAPTYNYRCDECWRKIRGWALEDLIGE